MPLITKAESRAESKVTGTVGKGVEVAFAHTLCLLFHLSEEVLECHPRSPFHINRKRMDAHADGIKRVFVDAPVPDSREPGFRIRVPGRQGKPECKRKNGTLRTGVLAPQGINRLLGNRYREVGTAVRSPGRMRCILRRSGNIGLERRFQLGARRKVAGEPRLGLLVFRPLTQPLFAKRYLIHTYLLGFQGLSLVCFAKFFQENTDR